MRVPTRRRQYGLRVDLTPLNDIVFLLIIFLVASPHFRPTETQTEVQLPEVPLNRGDRSRSPRRLEISVLASGAVRVEGKPLTAEELRQKIITAAQNAPGGPQHFELRLRTDRQAEYRFIEPILRTCIEAGIVDIKFAVLPATPSGG